MSTTLDPETATTPPPVRLDAATGLGRRPTRLAMQAAAFTALMLLWHLAAQSGIIPAILMPGPLDVAAAFWRNIASIVTGGHMRGHLLITLYEVVVGFSIAVGIGLTLGTFVSEFRLFRTIFMPYIVAFNATPRIALAPIFLIWFGFGASSKIVMAAATATFPVLIGTIAGLSATDKAQLRLMRAYGASRWQTFRKLRMYVALPYIFAGLETSVVLAVIGAVVGEFMGGNAGLGYIIVVAQESLQLALAFGTILLLSVVGLLLHRLVILVRARVVYWRGKDDEPLKAI